jgi:hypothetical protein
MRSRFARIAAAMSVISSFMARAWTAMRWATVGARKTEYWWWTVSRAVICGAARHQPSRHPARRKSLESPLQTIALPVNSAIVWCGAS